MRRRLRHSHQKFTLTVLFPARNAIAGCGVGRRAPALAGVLPVASPYVLAGIGPVLRGIGLTMLQRRATS